MTCNKKLHGARDFRYRSSSRHRLGFSLVELLIGLALGLFILSNGLLLLASHLNENRMLVLEARLMQDLRGAATAIARDLRRAGHWGDAGAAIWQEGASVRSNPYQDISSVAATPDTVRLRYSRDSHENNLVDSNEEFGFRLRNQAIDTMLGGSWQSLTDVTTVRVTAFRLTSISSDVEQPELCEKACPPSGPGAAECPPRLQIRRFAIEISGESPADPKIKRSIQTSARVRNDAIFGACPS